MQKLNSESWKAFLVKPELRPGTVQHLQPVQQTSGQDAVAAEPFGFFWFTKERTCVLCCHAPKYAQAQSRVKLRLAKDAEKKKVAKVVVVLKWPRVHPLLVSPKSQIAQSFRAGHGKVHFYEKKNVLIKQTFL